MNDWKDITQDIKRLTKIQDVIFKKLKETQDNPELYLKYVDAYLAFDETILKLQGYQKDENGHFQPNKNILDDIAKELRKDGYNV